MDLKAKYGSQALVAGASEGIGAAFATELAAAGLDLVLVARRLPPLEALAQELQSQYSVDIQCISCDLSSPNATRELQAQLKRPQIDIMVYNAALSYIGHFEEQAPEHRQKTVQTNMASPMEMAHAFGTEMLKRGKGAIVLMGSLAGNQGSGFLSSYAASKAFNRVLAEGLWYEWKDRGVDVIACCAGATSTPNYINTQPAKTSALAPKVQTPAEVAQECLRQLGRRPSVITGRGNRMANWFMQKLLPRKKAVEIMGDNTRKMYRIQ